MSYTQPVPPGPGSLVVAVIFPAFVIAVELATGFCAGLFFDPIPTWGHLMLVATVPAINLFLWRAARREDGGERWLLIAGGMAIAIAASYSLVLLPILPFAFIGILFLGIGLLPFAPLFTLVNAGKWTLELSGWHENALPRVLGGVGLGIAALALVDLPATATQIAVGRYAQGHDERGQAVSMMRWLGDRELLLRLSYGDTARATGLVSFLASFWSRGPFWAEAAPTAEARELYYRVTGKAFNAVPRPKGHGFGDGSLLFQWDEDQGGQDVGGRVPDLALAGSRIDGSVADRDNLAQLEWTFDIANSGEMAREARFTLALPEGAVASRATLWVNGEPREASIAGRGATRAAYAKVVSTARDPLLVTTDGAQRLLVQAFPINGNSTMRLRIGMTAPFQVAPDGRRTLALPAVVERNFEMDDSVRHAVWVEGDAALRGAARVSLADEDVLAVRPTIELPRVRTPWIASGTIAAHGDAPAIAVEQRVARAPAEPKPLMLVVDASADAKAAAEALATALDQIASGVPVGLVVAGDEPETVAPAAWSSAQAARIRNALAAIRFRGGQDGRAALARALEMMPRRDASLLWVHGAQPVRFALPEPLLEQTLDRLPERPELVRYQAVPGRALAIEGSAWFDTARLPTPSGDPEADLKAILADLAGADPRWRVTLAEAPATAPGSAALVRLWAAQQLAGAVAGRGKDRETAIALAHRLNLVTPVSGAVVLETDKDYKDNGLPVPDPDAVPTVPEPEVWALLILLAIAGAYLVRRQRQGAWA